MLDGWVGGSLDINVSACLRSSLRTGHPGHIPSIFMESMTATRGQEIPKLPLLPYLEFQESLWPLEICGPIRGG